jgi:hypothetical protein
VFFTIYHFFIHLNLCTAGEQKAGEKNRRYGASWRPFKMYLKQKKYRTSVTTRVVATLTNLAWSKYKYIRVKVRFSHTHNIPLTRHLVYWITRSRDELLHDHSHSKMLLGNKLTFILVRGLSFIRLFCLQSPTRLPTKNIRKRKKKKQRMWTEKTRYR